MSQLILPSRQLITGVPTQQLALKPEYLQLFESLTIPGAVGLAPENGVQHELEDFTKSGTINTVINALGKGVAGDGTTGHYYRSINIAAQPMWLLVVFRANSLNVTQKFAYGLGTSSTSAAFAGISSGNASVNNINGRLRGESGNMVGIIGPLPELGKVYTCVYVVPSALQSDTFLCVNGAFYNIATGGAADTSFTQNYNYETLGALKRNTVSYYSTDTIFLAGFGLGQMPRQLAQALSANPWQIFLPQKKMFFFDGTINKGSHLLLQSKHIVQPSYTIGAANTPLTQGLRHAFLMSADAVDVVTKQRVTKKSANTNFENTNLGKALWLDTTQTNERANFSNIYRPGSRDFTISCWLTFLRETATKDTAVVTVRKSTAATTNNEWFLSGNYGAVNNDYQCGFGVYSGTTVYNIVDPTKRFLNTPIHLTGVKKGSTITLYRDGVEVASASAPTSINVSTTAMRFGQLIDSDTIYELNANIHFFGMWSRALDATEIKNLANNPWQIFAPQKRVVYFDGAVSGGGNLTGLNSTQDNSSTTGTITQSHLLAALNSAQASTSTTGAIGQTSILTASNCTQANASTTDAITQTHNLTGADGSQSNTAGTDAITQSHVLTVLNSSQANTSTDGAITQDGSLLGAACTQANNATTGTISQTHILAGANATQDNNATTGVITFPGIDLTASNSSQSNASATGAITSIHQLLAANSNQIIVSSAGAIAQVHSVTGANCNQVNNCSTGAIFFHYLFTPSVYRYFSVPAESRIYNVAVEQRNYTISP